MGNNAWDQQGAAQWGTDPTTQVNIAQQGRTLAPEDQKALEGMTTALAQKQRLAQNANEFMRVQGNTALGPIYGDMHDVGWLPHVPNVMRNVVQPLADAMGGGHTAQTLQQLDAINNKTWTALRDPGSGPIRNYEAEGWKKAFPNTNNYGETNAQIAKNLNDDYNNHVRMTQFVTSYVRSGKGGVADALAAFNSQPTPQAQAPDPRQQAAQKLRTMSQQYQQNAPMIDINGNPVRGR
jgi:hypothetical protein